MSRPLFTPNSFSAGAVVDVLAAAERVDERFLAGHVREHAQLDLRVVGRDQDVARRGDERTPNLAAELGADRDVLQVRIRAAQTARRRDRLVEARVHASRLRMRPCSGQRVDVRALQLVQRAPLEDEPRQFVRERQLLEHFRGRRERPRLAGLLRRRAAAASRTGSRPAASAS